MSNSDTPALRVVSRNPRLENAEYIFELIGDSPIEAGHRWVKIHCTNNDYTSLLNSSHTFHIPMDVLVRYINHSLGDLPLNDLRYAVVNRVRTDFAHHLKDSRDSLVVNDAAHAAIKEAFRQLGLEA